MIVASGAYRPLVEKAMKCDRSRVRIPIEVFYVALVFRGEILTIVQPHYCLMTISRDPFCNFVTTSRSCEMSIKKYIEESEFLAHAVHEK